MKKTKVICLYGGPGVGKSTLAAELFAKFKKEGKSIELVREYVKDWAWEGREIKEYDQFYITAKQFRAESLLYGKVDYIITDSPVLLGPFYERAFHKTETMLSSVLGMMQKAVQNGVTYHHFVLPRAKAYVPDGRYQTEEEAHWLDTIMPKFLEKHAEVEYTAIKTPETSIDVIEFALEEHSGLSESDNLEQATPGRCSK